MLAIGSAEIPLTDQTSCENLKVQVKILLMNSQNHMFVFEPETTIGRVVRDSTMLPGIDLWANVIIAPPCVERERLAFVAIR